MSLSEVRVCHAILMLHDAVKERYRVVCHSGLQVPVRCHPPGEGKDVTHALGFAGRSRCHYHTGACSH
jgi:hypothetical protein